MLSFFCSTYFMSYLQLEIFKQKAPRKACLYVPVNQFRGRRYKAVQKLVKHLR